jgi:hypothetical protein
VSDETANTEPPEHDDVRRLLAEARHDEPIPAEVADRLDRVLAGLSQERTEAPADAQVIPLEAYRRRRAAGLLVAAAAIVVSGIAVAQHLPRDSGAQTTAGHPAENADTGADTASGAQTTSPQVAPGPSVDSSGQPQIKDGGVLVRRRHFAADALSGRQAVAPTGSKRYATALKSLSPGCVPSISDAELVPATYEKAPAALVYHAPAGSTQVVDLYICGSAKPVRSVTLPTP